MIASMTTTTRKIAAFYRMSFSRSPCAAVSAAAFASSGQHATFARADMLGEAYIAVFLAPPSLTSFAVNENAHISKRSG
jgi:hypothetical protein